MAKKRNCKNKISAWKQETSTQNNIKSKIKCSSCDRKAVYEMNDVILWWIKIEYRGEQKRAKWLRKIKSLKPVTPDIRICASARPILSSRDKGTDPEKGQPPTVLRDRWMYSADFCFLLLRHATLKLYKQHKTYFSQHIQPMLPSFSFYLKNRIFC